METVTENKFYSRRLTNEMRNELLGKIKSHVEAEFVNNPLFTECIEQINIFTEALWVEVYKIMPKEDVDVILKYPKLCEKTRVHITPTDSYYKKDKDYFPYSAEYWGHYVSFGPNFTDYYLIPENISVRAVFQKTMVALGVEKCKKFYDTLFLNECEKNKIFEAMKKILNSATTTGKLVDAYPDMMKFIPDEWKKKEQSSHSNNIKTKVAGVDIDVNAFLK